MAVGALDESDDVMNETNMTPLLGVMLVLLIIFIVTVPAMKPAMNVDLSRGSRSRRSPPATSSQQRGPGASDIVSVSRHAATLALLFAVAGCTTTGEYQDPGWRYAVIVGIGRHADLASTADQDCSGSLRPDAPFVVARYRDGQHSRSIGKLQRPADSSL